MKEYKNTRNPILPLDIHTPDSEAHMMPDGNLYIYGSYDDRENMYCSETYHVVSTGDLEHWTIYDEAIHGKDIPWFADPDAPKYPGNDWENPTQFMKNMRESTEEDDMNFVLEQEGNSMPPLLFAPDCISKNGKYYLYFCMADDSEGVAVSDVPQGPFQNPVRFPCAGIDPAVFVDDDGSAYYYWGQFRSRGVKLNEDMVSFDPKNIVYNLLTEEEHYFHEGSSVRKIGDTYYSVFADIERGKPTALGYATGKSPLGPFQYQGIIIDNAECDPSSWNNHGSIECVNGKWYVFYHRSSRNTKIFRRLCIEPITINSDGTIDEVIMTSQGPGKPFAPGEEIMGYQACGLRGTIYIDEVKKTDYEEKEKTIGECLSHIDDFDEAIFRYVENEKEYRKIKVKASGSGKMEVYMNDNYAGTVAITGNGEHEAEIRMEAGKYEVKLVFRDVQELEVYSFVLE